MVAVKYDTPGGSAYLDIDNAYVSLGGPDKGQVVTSPPGKMSPQSDEAVTALRAVPGVADVLDAAAKLKT